MLSLTRILCPVDFSDGSRHALDHAVALAKSYGARLYVFYVHHLAVPVPTVGSVAMAPPVPLSDAELGEITRSLSEFVADDRRAGVSIETLFEEDVTVPGAIVQSAARLNADLIVLGTHGRSGLTRLVLGSVAARVMKTAGRPVLVVPPRVRDAVPIALQRIVCPVDFACSSRRALEIAAALAEKHGARLTVLHVIDLAVDVPEPGIAGLDAYRAARFAHARAALDAALAPSTRTACAIDELLVVGKPYTEIVRIASEQEADLLVMGTRGNTVAALPLAHFGSTTQHVVREATCPVLAVPADERH